MRTRDVHATTRRSHAVLPDLLPVPADSPLAVGLGPCGHSALSHRWPAGLFQSVAVLSSTQVALSLPIAVQEMVLAVWLIVKGFSTKAAKAPAAELHPA